MCDSAEHAERMGQTLETKSPDPPTDEDILSWAIDDVCPDCKGRGCGWNLGTDCGAVKETVKEIEKEIKEEAQNAINK